MKKIFILIILFTNFVKFAYSEDIYKPMGCSASTGSNVSKVVLEHSELRYQLITIKWSDIEPNIDNFNFNELINKINMVKSYNKKYALAVSMGGPGTPEWLFDSLKVPFIDYFFRGTTHYKLPLWWNDIVLERIEKIIKEIGRKFSSDTSLALVYVSQMTSNGNEGHLQGVSMDTLKLKGFTNEKWIDAAKKTTYFYANSFPNKAIAFEIHDIDFSSDIPIRIMNDLYEDKSLEHRVGAAIWWLSGKTTYQLSLLNYLTEFKGGKYGQMIANSTQKERFKDSTIASAFAQAKELNIKYIELWYEEYKNNTIDSMMNDFNRWVDSTSATDIEEGNKMQECNINIYPNPANEYIEINYGSIGACSNDNGACSNDNGACSNDNGASPIASEIKIYNTFAELVMNVGAIHELPLQRIDISHLPVGFYFIKMGNYSEKFIIR